MANPIDFPESNFTFTKPKGMTDEECSSLPVLRMRGSIVSKWKMTEEELATIAETGEIWLSCWTPVQFPVWVGTERPFVVPEDN